MPVYPGASENPLYTPYRSLSDRLLDDQLPVRRELTAKPLALCPALSVTIVRLSQLEAATGLAGIRHPGGSSPKRRKGMPTRKPAVLFAVLAALLLAVLAACAGSQTPGAPKANPSSSGTPTAAQSPTGDASARSLTLLSTTTPAQIERTPHH